jgi:hypothetical protein
MDHPGRVRHWTDGRPKLLDNGVWQVVCGTEIGRCEQSYTDADARSAHTHQFRALPSHQPPTHECPRALAGLVIGWPLSSVA